MARVRASRASCCSFFVSTSEGRTGASGCGFERWKNEDFDLVLLSGEAFGMLGVSGTTDEEDEERE